MPDEPDTIDTRTGLAAARPGIPAIPVSPEERILTLDVLRGIALLGVLIANVWLWFSGIWFRFPGYYEEMRRPTLDAMAYHLISVLVSGKAVTTFAFLFGVGFAVQMLRAEERGVPIAPLYLRRLAVLLLFGLAHAVLLWYGDILNVYALLGFVLLVFRRRSDRTLLVSAGLLGWVIPVAFVTAMVAMHVLAGDGAGPGGAARDGLAELRSASLAAFQHGSYLQVVQANLRMVYFYYVGPLVIYLLYWLGIFLVGLYAGRRRIFQEVERHRAALRRLAVWGISLGIAGAVAYTVPRLVLAPAELEARPWLGLLMAVLEFTAIPLLAFGYIAAATLLLQRTDWRRRLGVFAPVGRMALTNYLAQTLICLAIFYGGGLVGRVGPAAGLLVSLLVFGVQMAWSPWWLARFRFGPLEWVWRSLTYGHPQPMRIRGGTAVPVPA